MSKTVQSVKNSLKFKAQEKQGVLSVKVGAKKFPVPVGVRILSSGEYLFLSFPASSELYRLDQRNLTKMSKDEDATEAFAALNPGKRRAKKRGGNVAISNELAEALKAIPSGYKLGYGADGSPKLVKTRRRGKASE